MHMAKALDGLDNHKHLSRMDLRGLNISRQKFVRCRGYLFLSFQRPDIIFPLTTNSEQKQTPMCMCVFYAGVDSIQTKFVS
jgi:hypothetical protein